MLHNYGSATKYHHEVGGYNSHLNELQAALLAVNYLPNWTAQRQQLAAWYSHRLAAVPGLRLAVVAPGATHVYHLYVVHTAQRDALQRLLGRRGIGTQVHYPVHPHRQPAYAHLGLPAGALPRAEMLAATCLSLPLWSGLTAGPAGWVIEAIQTFFCR